MQQQQQIMRVHVQQPIASPMPQCVAPNYSGSAASAAAPVPNYTSAPPQQKPQQQYDAPPTYGQ